MPKKTTEHKRLSDEPFVIDAIKRIQEKGIEHATTKDMILFIGSHLNDEIESVSDKILDPVNNLTRAIKWLAGSVIAGIIIGIIVFIITSFIPST